MSQYAKSFVKAKLFEKILYYDKNNSATKQNKFMIKKNFLNYTLYFQKKT